jgi:hypothetical protein
MRQCFDTVSTYDDGRLVARKNCQFHYVSQDRALSDSTSDLYSSAIRRWRDTVLRSDLSGSQSRNANRSGNAGLSRVTAKKYRQRTKISADRLVQDVSRQKWSMKNVTFLRNSHCRKEGFGMSLKLI